MKITNGNTRYVLECGDEIIDLILNNMNYTMSGEGQVMVSWEEIISWTECEPSEATGKEKLYFFLCAVEQVIKGEVGDVVFCT